MKKFIPIALVFVIVSALVLMFFEQLEDWKVHTNFLIGANVILFVLSTIGFFIQTRGAVSVNTNVFIRGVYTSLLLKMFLIVGAVLVYVVIIGGDINKRALLASLFLYTIYTAVEVSQVMKLLRNKKNG